MEKHYDFIAAQEKWIRQWNDSNAWHINPDDRQHYSIVIPPPNVTDILHIGHALNNTIQDILIRYKRNSGLNTLWLPGTDHAGIATQVVVEKKLAKEGKSKHDLGREAFLEEVWSWVEERKNRILHQLEGIGASCDWERKKFTLDESMSRTVAHVFKELYDKDLIYRGTYIVNWCPRCHTALSDEEVEYEDRNGKLYYIKYPVENSDAFITIATTRPETMLGDTAVAVNPNDKDKAGLIGKHIILPLMDRPIPIIADDYVDMEFGTGFVKVTPAHDPNDFLIGKRHELEEIIIMDENGVINENGGQYRGLTREDARRKIIEDLEKAGLIDHIEDYSNSVGTCYRCKTTIEPYLSEQWFVRMKELAEPALQASKDNQISFYPARWKGVYDHWLSNIRDWCISRQLWWGHRIPVYYCNKCNNEFVSVDSPDSCPKCGASDIRQDENVLDTWFSSWLWPFSTLGWLDDEQEYQYYYPTNVIVSASEILFFWIARMIMAGLYFTGELPFRDIYIHGTVRDEKGRKMSKSLGNGIDPLEITSQYGADALRFSLLYVSGQGKDPNINKQTFEIGRNFANKIWNAARFIIMNTDNIAVPKTVSPHSLYDEWILTGISELENRTKKNIDSYRFYDYVRDMYEFFWHDFCDWYLEIIKLENSSFDTALYVLNRFLRLLNPVMPFITEEINEIIGNSEMIHTGETDHIEYSESDATDKVAILRSLVTSIRNLMAETGMHTVRVIHNERADFLEQELSIVSSLSRCKELSIIKDKPAKAIPSVFSEGMIFIPAESIDDIDRILEQYRKEEKAISAQLKKTENTLANENFIKKAASEVVEGMKEKEKQYKEKLERVIMIIDSLA